MPETNEHDEKCGCGKQLAAAVTKAAHRDQNTGTREPAVPAGRKINLDGVTSVPADLSHLVPRDIRDGGQALQYLRYLAAGQSAGGGNGGAAGTPGAAPAGEIGVTYAGATPSQYASCPGLARLDAGRGASGYTPQANAKGGRR
jgi:hypothetical protein